MTSQALLDLEWVVTSPPLMADPLAVQAQTFDRSRVDVAHLEAFLAERPSYRVGRYFETLLHYWLAHVRKVEVVEAGLQIRDDQQRTVGELDFVYRDEAGRLCHCEASVKFFLHHPNEAGSHFPGPAARDNLERKANKLFGSQLELGQEHLPDIENRLGFVRGRVFYELDADEPAERPQCLAANHGRGLWVRSGAVDQLERFEDRGFHFVDKPTWLAPMVEPEVLSFPRFLDQLDDHFEGPAFPVMVSIRNGEGSETQRCFVVPDEWPVG